MSLTIREKTLLAAGLILIILLGPSIYSLLKLRRISDLSAALAGPGAETGATAARLEELFNATLSSAQLMRVDPDYEAKMAEGIEEIRSLLDRLGRGSAHPIARACERTGEALDAFQLVATSEETEPARLETAGAEVKSAIRRIRAANQRLAREHSAEAEQLADRAARFTMIATAVGLVVALALWGSLILALTRPLDDLVKGTERIARGQFDELIPVRASDELGRLAVAFNRMSEALGDLEKMKAEFLAAASHGLRTPLACAKGHLSGLRAGRQGPLTEEGHRTASRLESELDRVSRFVDQLMDLGRLRVGRLSMSIRWLPASAFFTSVGRSFEAIAEEKRIVFTINVDGSLPQRIQADPDRLGEALTNLLENAFKYTPDGGSVSMDVRGAAGRVRVEVSDSGPGIPEGEEALIFERYYRGGGVTAQGTGLGLAIARGIIEQHGGTIRAQGGDGGGARFIFEVPVVQVAA